MAKALSQYHIAGVKNNINFLHSIISSDAFCKEPIDTQFINKNPELLTESLDNDLCFALASCVDILAQSQSAQDSKGVQTDRSFDIASQWRMNTLSVREMYWQPLVVDQDNEAALQLVTVSEASQQLASKNNFNTARRDFSVTVNAQVFNIQASLESGQLTATVNGKQFKLDTYQQGLQLFLFFNGKSIQLLKPDTSGFGDDGQQQGALTAPMNGRVIAVLVEAGQAVKAGTPLIIIEAMKMEHSITAHEDSVVDEIFFNESDLVAEGDKLISMQTHGED
jgi:3-methylcrotonyl-CoA carboxylase alpha subunit